jgi:hypothetical protein
MREGVLGRLLRASHIIIGNAPSHGPGALNLPALGEAWVGTNKLINPNRLTELAANPEYFADFVTLWDNSAGDVRKIKPRFLGPSVIARGGSSTNLIDNSNVETVLMTALVRGNSLGLNGKVRARFSSSYLNNSGAGQAGTLRVKFGGVTLFADASAAIAASAAQRMFDVDVELGNVGVANAQLVNGIWTLGSGTPTTGIGAIGTQALVTASFGGVGAIDTTADQTFEVTWQFTNANANLEIQTNHWAVEVI